MPRVRLRFWTWLWSLASGGLIGNLSGYSPASALLPEKARALVCLPGSKTWEQDDTPYRCIGVSIWTALLFSLLGLAVPC